jgi:flagellar FliL protein
MADEKASAQGSKHILIMILISLNLLTMLGVAGIVFWAYVNEPQQEGIVDVVTNENRVREVMGSDEVDYEDDGDAMMGPTFPLERFIVNLADKGGGRYLNVIIDLELNNEELTDEIEKRLPQIRDTILVLLSGKRYDQISDVDGKRRLRDEIMKTINTLLTTGRIKSVYFTNFVIN